MLSTGFLPNPDVHYYMFISTQHPQALLWRSSALALLCSTRIVGPKVETDGGSIYLYDAP